MLAMRGLHYAVSASVFILSVTIHELFPLIREIADKQGPCMGLHCRIRHLVQLCTIESL